MNLSGSGSGLSRLPSMGKSLQSLETFQQNLPPQQSQSKPPKNTKTIIIVVNVLPLVFSRNATNTGWDVEWNSTATAMFYRNLIADTDKYKSLYVGCPEVFVSKEEESMVEKQLRTLNCVPVFLDPLTAHRYYQGYCKGVLWPIFHNVVDVYNSASLTLDEDTTNVTNKPDARRRNSWCDPVSWNPGAQDKCWADYCSVNRTFARRVMESFHEGNIVWIQDYHFLMLPSYLLRKLKGAIIAIYLHAPFPSSEIFRCLASRTDILRAMLCANHIGFLVFEHVRHFLTSCKRLLGLNYKTSYNGMLELEYNGRKVMITCSHIEPDTSHLFNILNKMEGNEESMKIKKTFESYIFDSENKRKFVLASVDRLEGLSALPLKLRAFDKLMASNPHLREAVVLIQIGLSLDSRPNDYNQAREYVTKFVEEINRRWSPPGEKVIHYHEKYKTTSIERMNLWCLSDAFLDTSVRSGLSLLPFEFLVAQKQNEIQNRDDISRHFGTMIISEFASCSRVLNGSILINPWKAEDIVNAITKCVHMQNHEKRNRFQLNYKFLTLHSDSRWSDHLLADIEASAVQETKDGKDSVEVGFGFDYRVMHFNSSFVKLNVDDLVRKYTKSTRRLFVFDYGGTLSWTASILEEGAAAYHFNPNTGSLEMDTSEVGSREPQAKGFPQHVIRYIDGQVRTPLTSEARDNIRSLCDNPQNIVFIVSTGSRGELDAEFGTMSNLNLIADNGLYFRKARESAWECLCNEQTLDTSWKEEVKKITKAYADRTNGAFIVINEASILYDYRNSDPEYGEIQALELYEQLQQVLKKGTATVYRGKGFVEIHQFGVSKCVAISLVLNYLKENVAIPDFIFCAGDDESDEQAFRAVHEFCDKETQLKNVFTCIVGMKPSNAKFYVDGISDILAAIHAIAVRIRFDSSKHNLLTFKSFADVYQQSQGKLVASNLIRCRSNDSLVAKIVLTHPTPSATLSESAIDQVKETKWGNWLYIGGAIVIGSFIGWQAAKRSGNLKEKFHQVRSLTQ